MKNLLIGCLLGIMCFSTLGVFAQGEAESVLEFHQLGKEPRVYRNDLTVNYRTEDQRRMRNGYIRSTTDSTVVISTDTIKIASITEFDGVVEPDKKDKRAFWLSIAASGFALGFTVYLYLLSLTVSTLYFFPFLMIAALVPGLWLMAILSLRPKRKFSKGFTAGKLRSGKRRKKDYHERTYRGGLFR